MSDRVAKGKAIAERLRDEAKAATRTWTLVEAFNGRDEQHREELRRSLDRLGLGTTTNVVLRSLVRDTLASLFRISDDAGDKADRQTFCALVPLIEDSTVVTALEDDARTPEFLERENVALVQRSIAHIRECVPSRWKQGPPTNSALFDLRQRLRPVRDALLSHALDYANIQQATFGETRDFLRITNELEASASAAFHCLSEPLQARWDNSLAHAHRFWDVVELGSKGEG